MNQIVLQQSNTILPDLKSCDEKIPACDPENRFNFQAPHVRKNQNFVSQISKSNDSLSCDPVKVKFHQKIIDFMT